MSKQTNFFKIDRKLLEHPLWLSEPFTKGQAWIDLVGAANFKANFFFKRGIKIDVKRGQTGKSIMYFMRRWAWSKGKVSRFLHYLENESMIEQKRGNQTTIVTICNYEIYQATYKSGDTANSPANDTTNEPQMIPQVVPQVVHKQVKKERKNKKKKECEFSIHSKIINYLNQICGTRIKLESGNRKTIITSRLAEGYSFEDFKSVIDFKNSDWKPGLKFSNGSIARKYLKPETLFINKNFDTYLNESIISKPQQVTQQSAQKLKSFNEIKSLITKLLPTIDNSDNDGDYRFDMQIMINHKYLHKYLDDAKGLFRDRADNQKTEQNIKLIYQAYQNEHSRNR